MNTTATLRFGEFTLELDTGELSRGGERVTLRPQATEVLLLLARNAGQLVTRGEIRERIWRDSTVEFDQGINACIRQIRQTLDDEAAHPRWIETVPRRGYRFIGLEPPRAATEQDAYSAWRPMLLISVAALLVATALAFVIRVDTPSDGRIIVAVRVVPHNAAPAEAELPRELGAALHGALVSLDTTRVQVVAWRWATRWNRETGMLHDDGRTLPLDYLVTANVSRIRDSVRIEMYVERIGSGMPVWQRITTMPFAEREPAFRELANGMRSAFAENLLAAGAGEGR